MLGTSMRLNRLNKILLCSSVLVLLACGGSGDSGSSGVTEHIPFNFTNEAAFAVFFVVNGQLIATVPAHGTGNGTVPITVKQGETTTITGRVDDAPGHTVGNATTTATFNEVIHNIDFDFNGAFASMTKE